MAESDSPTTRDRWIRVLQIVFALALFGFVLSRVPFTDTLLLTNEQGIESETPIEILGSWHEDEIQVRDASGSERSFTRSEGVDWRPGLFTLFRELRLQDLALAVAVALFAQFIVITRWWLLLGVGRCGTRWLEAFRLTFLGLFFNLVVPGATGGDLVKSVLAVRDHPERRLAALVSIVIDRALGLFGVFLLASFALTLLLTDPSLGDETRKLASELRPFVYGATACAALGLGLWLIGPSWFERLALRLPGGTRLAAIVHSGRDHRRAPGVLTIATIFSVTNHLCNASVVYLLAQALGSTLSWPGVTSATTIGSSAASIPLSPGGLGVLEGAIGYLFEALGSTLTLGVAAALSWRLILILLGLLGGLLLILPGGRRARAEALAAARTATS